MRRATLSERQVPAAASLLARAFIDDPGAGIVEPVPARRFDANRVLFELDLRATLGSAWACLEAGALVGVAVWLAPGAAVQTLDERQLSAARTAVGDAAVDRWAALLDDFERVRGEATDSRHWFLALLGVDPSAQGNGVGAALLGVGHRAADRDDLPCVLETFTAANVAYYRRRGYQLILSTTVADRVPVYAMSRPPRSAA